ncbi:MAG: hypothetical protein ACFFDY_13710 [Candidatus Thorarchaeota archaeon]
MEMKKKSKVTKALIAVLFLIGIIAIVTPVMAANSNRGFFMAKGDDLDIPGAKNIIIGKIKFGAGDEPSSAQVNFYSKIYDDSGKKVYTMIGMLNDGDLINPSFSFFCPLYKVWFINVWQFMGQGKFKTTDTNIEVYFRDMITITMPNTEGKFVSKPIVMLLSHTAEYCKKDTTIYTPGSPENPIFKWPVRWALAAVAWYYPEIGELLPIGPLSSLTISKGI